MRRAIEALVVTLLVAIFAETFVVRIYSIPSISMIPTLGVGDVVFANMLAYRFRSPQDNDLALFISPDPREKEPLIKRVIGSPGESIRITDGVVYRNGQPLDEPYENLPPDYNLTIDRYGVEVDDGTGILEPLSPQAAAIPPKRLWQAPNRIPAGFYFVLGDNRRYSRDSHVWGLVPQKNFTATALAILWPLHHVRIF